MYNFHNLRRRGERESLRRLGIKLKRNRNTLPRRRRFEGNERSFGPVNDGGLDVMYDSSSRGGAPDRVAYDARNCCRLPSCCSYTALNLRTGSNETAGQVALRRAARPHQPGGGGLDGTKNGEQGDSFGY